MSGGLKVTRVDGRQEREEFIALPYGLHRSDPCWAPVLRRDVRAMLDPSRNPFFEHGSAAYFLARRGSRVAGRIAAIENRLHNEVHADGVGFFGFFECEDDAEAAAALFGAATGWLKERGFSAARGPVSFSMNDEAGLLVDGFETPAVLMMPHNPPHYARLVEGSGFQKAKDLVALYNTHSRLPERLVEGTALLERRYGIRTRPLDIRRYDQEIALLKRLYNASWERNWGFVPMTDREVEHLARQLKPVIVPALVGFAEREGEAIGLVAAVPDFNVALRANPSGRLFPGIVKILWASRRIHRVRVLILGTVPAWRGKGLDAVLYRYLWENATSRGYPWGEAGWVLEDNHAIINGLTRIGFVPYKTYRVYERPL